MNGLERAIELAGGASALARKLNHAFPSRVGNWRRRRVPAAEVAAIEHALDGRVRAEQIRPDLTWHRDATGRLTGYTVPVLSSETKAA